MVLDQQNNNNNKRTDYMVLLAPNEYFYDWCYSVMQSDGESFCGDIVLDSFNILYSDEDSIRTNNMNSESAGIFIMKILNFKSA